MSRALPFFVGSLVLGLACSAPTGLCACTYAPPTIQVTGRVLAADGASAPDVRVVGRFVQLGLPAPPSSQSMPSDGEGRFTLSVVASGYDGEAWVALAAARPGRTDSARVQLRLPSRGALPTSLQADVILP